MAGSGARSSLRAKTETQPIPDLVPEQGVKLTPRHYAYLKILKAVITAAPSALFRLCAATWEPSDWRSVK